jgi:hypothetical protein
VYLFCFIAAVAVFTVASGRFIGVVAANNGIVFIKGE